MEAKAQARHVRVTPMKARRVVDLIRGKQATEAIAVLQFAPQAASEPVLKVLESAIANARVKADKAAEAFDERTLVISEAYVDEGATMKRFRPRAQGRAYRIRKRTSHITVRVTQPIKNTAKGGGYPWVRRSTRTASAWESPQSTRAIGSQTAPRWVSDTATSSRKMSRSASS